MEWKTLLHPPPTNKELLTRLEIEGKEIVRKLVFDGIYWRDSENKIVQQNPSHWKDER